MPELPEYVTVNLAPEEIRDEAALRRRIAQHLALADEELPPFRVHQRALDARRGRVMFRVLVALGDAPGRPLGGLAPRRVEGAPVVIVGDGPAGLFCAYQLARYGIAATVLERGKPVQPRRHDLKGLQRHGRVDPDSNYCFGEGGAGTYSDGKLYTRATKRGNVRDVLEILTLHGAPDDILVNTRPHIGSNRLPKVVSSLRQRLEQEGVEFHFGQRVVELLRQGTSSTAPVGGVECANGERFSGTEVVMATGHSARDIFELLLRHNVVLENKGFALGVRIEHPQPQINRMQYGALSEHPNLPNAAYRLTANTAEGGVFSFCMCPGGFVVPACTDGSGLVVNGMSLSRRDSPYANSGLVCATAPEQWAQLGLDGPLAGVALQQRLESAALAAGDASRLAAPATRATDFMAGRASSNVPSSSYLPGLVASDVSALLDGTGLDLAERLREALRYFNRQMRGYISEDAVLIGVESRTSAPVRVPRDVRSLQCSLPGLYPCGEGAGYAGGIVSAALDGMRVADAIAQARGLELLLPLADPN